MDRVSILASARPLRGLAARSDLGLTSLICALSDREKSLARSWYGRAGLPALSRGGLVNHFRGDGSAGESRFRFAAHCDRLGRGDLGIPIFQREEQDGDSAVLRGSHRRGPE